MRRILCLVLVILMVLGCASYTVIFLIAGAFSSSAANDNPLMSIGIAYGDGAVSEYRTYSSSGYLVLSQNPDGARESLALWEFSDQTLVVVPHRSTNSYNGVSFAGNRIEIAEKFNTVADAKNMISKLSQFCSKNGCYTIPAYVDGYYRVRLGTFSTFSLAESVADKLSTATGVSAYALNISDTEVSVLASDGSVKFEYSMDESRCLGLVPSGDSYIRTDNGYNYKGTFAYKRSGNKLTVINIVFLETYIEGVLPYEISSTWPAEAQKAFAVAARSYAIGNRGKHYTSYGFDLCSTTNCQVYRGHGGVNDAVRSAVAETAGQILTYNGKAVSLYYSSSTGGCTVSAEDCWGGKSAPYLTAVTTPWERYVNYSNGLWTAEVTPSELCTYLRNKGYTTLSGEIADITIDSLAASSTYVRSVTFTDTSGNSVTITNTDKIRTTLSAYLKSANFTVARGKNTYTVQTVTANTQNIPYSSFNTSSFDLITSYGQIGSNGALPKVYTGSGILDVTSPAYVITAANVSGDGGTSIIDGYTTSYETRTYTASSQNNFVFVGKGWGHGVGLSQWGTRDLADFGYNYKDILKMYVPSLTISSVSSVT